MDTTFPLGAGFSIKRPLLVLVAFADLSLLTFCGPAFGRIGAAGFAATGLGVGVLGRLGVLGLLIGAFGVGLLVIGGAEGFGETVFGAFVRFGLIGTESLGGLL